MFTEVDWSHGAEHMLDRHGVTVTEATEALEDSNAIVFDPDPKSDSGDSIRVIGWSGSRGEVVTVILVRDGDTPYGASGWRTDGQERRMYGRRP